MKKATYIILSIIGYALSIFWLLLGNAGLKTLGLIIFAVLTYEYVTGKYKNFLDENLSKGEKKDQKKQFNRMLLPFIIIGIIIILFVIFLLTRHLF
jgi:multisubunit Na+/H+ antiporter MnhB subunit